MVQQFAVNPIGQVKTTTKGDKQECIATLSVSLKKELIGLRMNRIKKRIDHFVSQVMIKWFKDSKRKQDTSTIIKPKILKVTCLARFNSIIFNYWTFKNQFYL